MTSPKVLFLGCDKGAWQMRGRQMADAMGGPAVARCATRAHQIDWSWPEVIVLVKRAAEVWWKETGKIGIPVIWDVLDYWKQPRDNSQGPAWHLARTAQVQRESGARLVIGATQAMATAIGGVYLPHHSRLGLRPKPIRPRVELVAYDGSPRYLGSWKGAIERACDRLGMRFVINPPDIREADLLVAFRGDEWDGWACREWKSGVKYVNAIAAGRPILTQGCAAFGEIQPAGAVVERPGDLVTALQTMAAYDVRQMAYVNGLARVDDYTDGTIAARYQQILRSALRRAA